MKEKVTAVRKGVMKMRTASLAASLIIVLLSSFIFALRYLPAFEIPNFYAEDGKVFLDNALHKNPVEAIFTAFNGYLISGLYIIAEIAVLIYKVFGLHFYQLPVVLAILSCIFLGLTASLPYLLLRKQLGVKLSLVAVIFGTLIAIPSFDYAIIGTIGNLKFLFLYWAFLFCLYRINNSTNAKKVIFVDVILFLCVITYAPAIFILPFALWPYREKILKLITKKKREWGYLLTPYVLSLIVLLILSAIYLVVVYVKGIPKIPGYLDTPYDYGATFKLLYRVTWYEWLFPISSTLRDLVSLGLFIIVLLYGLISKHSRFITVLAVWAIFISTISFVVNRPGISSYFMAYGPNPDQFFYAQTLVFMVLCLWIIKPVIDRNKSYNNAILFFALFLFIWWSLPATGSFGKNRVIYEGLGTAKQNVKKACAEQNGSKVVIQSYPTEEWKWEIERSIACR